MTKREKTGIIIFLIIIFIEIIAFWGRDILTMIIPKSYFTESNISKDIKRKVATEESMFVLNEEATFTKNTFGVMEIESIEVEEDRCEVDLSVEWEGAEPLDIVYDMSLVYQKEGLGRWKISTFRVTPVASPEGLIGTWAGNVSQEEDFFNSAYNYDIEFRFESVDGNTLTGTVLAYDRLGTEEDDAVPFVAVWNDRTATVSITAERGITTQAFGISDKQFDPEEGALKSGNAYRKVD